MTRKFLRGLSPVNWLILRLIRPCRMSRKRLKRSLWNLQKGNDPKAPTPYTHHFIHSVRSMCPIVRDRIPEVQTMAPHTYLRKYDNTPRGTTVASMHEQCIPSGSSCRAWLGFF